MNTPKASRAQIAEILAHFAVTKEFALVGIRGEDGHNDRNVYDDAIYLITPHSFVPFNANTDPAKFRDGIATLKSGVWQYRVGTHGLSKPPEQQYIALVQAEPVTVSRDGGKTETGFFGINIHRGGQFETLSAGCQTIYKHQWPAFISLVMMEMGRNQKKTIPYVLYEWPKN